MVVNVGPEYENIWRRGQTANLRVYCCTKNLTTDSCCTAHFIYFTVPHNVGKIDRLIYTA